MTFRCPLDTTELYYYPGQQMIETRNGSELATRQFVFGTLYVDEVIAVDVNGDDEDSNLEDCDPDVTQTGETAGYDQRYWYHQDANFNVVAITDDTVDAENGVLEVEYYQYSPYGRLAVFDGDYRPRGEPTLTTGDPDIFFTNPFTYTGRFHDLETGNYYYRARYYQPNLGRFLQRDPLAFLDGLDLLLHYRDGLNLYLYGSGDPIGRFDPSGLITVSECYGIYNILRNGCLQASVQCFVPVVGVVSVGVAGCLTGCGITALNPFSYGTCVGGCICIDSLVAILQIGLCWDILQDCNDTANDQLRRCLRVADPG